jgi:3-oxoacyl-[acyl-carrier protein] reductase
MYTLEGLRAVCLASSKGLGFGIALEMVRAGARVLMVSRHEENLQEAASQILSTLDSGGTHPGVSRWHRPETLTADLLEETAAEQVMARAAERLGGIDILVNNIAGPSPGTFEELSPAQWEDAFRRLFLTVVRQLRSALPWLRKSPSPRVLTVTSVSARQPIPGLLLSNVFRPGLVGLAKTLAQEWGPEGILVNNLAPGMFETERAVELEQRIASQKGLSLEQVREERCSEIPLRRYGKPEELGRVAVFLASPANTYITGQTILVDGGLYGGL